MSDISALADMTDEQLGAKVRALIEARKSAKDAGHEMDRITYAIQRRRDDLNEEAQQSSRLAAFLRSEA